jgi:hypothetical protein
MKQSTPQQIDDTIDIPDVGGIDLGEFDAELFDFMADEVADTENRYIKPRLVPMRVDQVMFENAQDMAREIRIAKEGDRYDAIVSGSFIFGDFIEAFLIYNQCKAVSMTITTLSLSQENIDSLNNLMEHGYIDELNIIVSDYFYSHESRNLIPYMYKMLDIDNRFQLAVAFVHTKTVHFTTLGGKRLVMQGSANLRSSGNCEQFTIEYNSELCDFYDRVFNPILERFATIRKTAPRKTQWRDMTTMQFNLQ